MFIPIEIYFLFFLIALLYSSVGHGGASGYIAIFALFGIASPKLVSSATCIKYNCRINKFYKLLQVRIFSKKLLLPFVLTSIPAAFIGGLIKISEPTFDLLLSVALILSGIRLLFLREIKTSKVDSQIPLKTTLTIGMILGFAAGVLGIGGGVFLSPLLLFFGWANAKQTAATSSAFIVLNSISGLASQTIKGNFNFELIIPFIAIVFVGGFLGSRLGSSKLSFRKLQAILGIVLLFAGIKTIFPLIIA